MILAEIMDAMKTQLQARIASWSYEEAQWFEVAAAGDPEPRSQWAVMIEELGQRYDQNAHQTSADIGFEITWVCPGEEIDRFIFHSSLDEDGMQRAIWNLNFEGLMPRIEGSSDVIYTDVDVGNTETPIPIAMRTVVLRWEFDFSDAREFPASDIPSSLPVLTADLADAWGITIMRSTNIMYLTEGTPLNFAEAEIHSFDLNTNDRRMSEISAGIITASFHHGLDNDGVHLFSLGDGGTRGTWSLNKIDPSLNTLIATKDLGAGNFTGVHVYGPSNNFVSVSEHYGAGTRYHVFHTSDLSEADDQDLTVSFGSAWGCISLGRFSYDVVAATLVCTYLGERRYDLDINLGGFRTQWRDIAIRGETELIVSGVESVEGGDRGILRAFPIPDEVQREYRRHLAALPTG